MTPPWRRVRVRDAVMESLGVDRETLEAPSRIATFARSLGIETKDSDPAGKTLMAVFEEKVEAGLIQPTFVTHYPVEVSPLSRRNNDEPSIVDRFELYICGKEIANAFSELNDPADQRERFLQQLREREAGDEEAHEMDDDYIRVLEYGMPPTAGEGIVIDRLVMLFTDSASIRDVILYPRCARKTPDPSGSPLPGPPYVLRIVYQPPLPKGQAQAGFCLGHYADFHHRDLPGGGGPHRGPGGHERL
jgi:lysyl-tRNA synthetase class 2